MLDLMEGMLVEAKFQGRPRYFSGRVLVVHTDSATIEFEDGDVDDDVKFEDIKVLDSALITGVHAESLDFEQGMRVCARHRGSESFTPATISSANGRAARVSSFPFHSRLTPTPVSPCHRKTTEPST